MESCELLRAEVVIDSTLGGEGWGYSSYCDGVFIVGLSEILHFTVGLAFHAGFVSAFLLAF